MGKREVLRILVNYLINKVIKLLCTPGGEQTEWCLIRTPFPDIQTFSSLLCVAVNLTVDQRIIVSIKASISPKGLKKKQKQASFPLISSIQRLLFPAL